MVLLSYHCLERGSEVTPLSWKVLEQTSVPLTIQEPWTDLSPSCPICLPSSSFLKCRVVRMSCTPCQTTKPACPNKPVLLWLSSPGMLILMLLPLGPGAQACLRNCIAASSPGKTIVNIPGNKENESLIVKGLGFCLNLLPEDSENFLQIQGPSRSKCSTRVYATVKNTIPILEKNLSVFCLCEFTGILHTGSDPVYCVTLKRHSVLYWENTGFRFWKHGYR